MEQGDLFQRDIERFLDELEKHLSPQCRSILSRLRGGPVTNKELIDKHCFRYGARLHEIRNQLRYGLQIVKRQLEGGVWEYRLAR